MIDRASLRETFRRLVGDEPRLFRAPGRVNLIGEHTDYNDGFVFPMAIDRETVVAARLRTDSRVRVHALDMNETAEFDLAGPSGPKRRGSWLDYVEGIARVLQERGSRLAGCELAIHSDVPSGAGLSSSAALEVSVGLALLSLSGTPFDPVQLALAAQQTEHEYAGVKSGIMDQLIAALGRRGEALLIDCRSLETRGIPLDTTQIAVVVCDTRVKHELASTAYNTRREECEQGVRLLSQWLPGIRALRDVSLAEFERHQEELPEVTRRRCRHVVTENARTLTAAEALATDDVEAMGRLMYLSHRSLRDDYEVSSPELDALVEIASGIAGVVGARMTGGGFGGCTVSFVRRDAVALFEETVQREYRTRFSLEPEIYLVEPDAGAEELAGH